MIPYQPYQATLRRGIDCVGVGLHSGRRTKLTLRPAAPDTGIVFRRLDQGGFEIPATAAYLSCINHATCVARDGVVVQTVEHLLAALSCLGVDNAVVDLDSPEIPILDGSAAPFIYLIHEAGIRRLSAERQFIKIKRPLQVGGPGSEKQVAIYPADTLRVSYTIAFDHPLLRHQHRSIKVDDVSFVDEIAPARTFGFLKDVEQMRQNGLALGGSLENAVVIGETGVLNNPLRFADEFVRHKILDVLGDLALLGRPLLGHVVALRAGHALHTELVRRILVSPESWEAVSLGEPVPAGMAAAEAALTESLS